MYVPKVFHWFGPVGTVLTGFFINQQLYGGGLHLDVTLFVQLPLVVIASEWGAYIWQAGVAYQNFITNAPLEPSDEIINWNTGEKVDPQTGLPFVAPLNVDGQFKKNIALAQVVEMPKFNAERNFARTLIDMRNHNLEVDLREEYWIVRKNYKASREKFVKMLAKWERWKIICRAGGNKNSPYEVIDWRKVRLIAQGEELPEYPARMAPSPA